MTPESKSLISRLRGRYPVGPIMENGEPEFGYRDMCGPAAIIIPPVIDLEAAKHIEELEAKLAALRDDAARLDFVAAHPEKQLQHHKKRWSFIGFTNYPYDVFDTPRAAIDAAIRDYK